MKWPSASAFYLFILVTTGILFVVALYVEYQLGIAPCPLCVLQRLAFAGIGITMLIAILHQPGRLGKIIYATLGILFSFLGMALSARQIWLQHHPLEPNAPCLPGFVYLIKTFSLDQALKLVLRGTIECGRVNWTLFHLSMAEWAFLYFALFAFLSLFSAFSRK